MGNLMRCNFCGYENTEGNVRELTRTEKNFFDGVTIDAGSTDGRSEENFNHQRNNYNYRARGTYINFNDTNIFGRAVGSFLRALIKGNRLAQIAMILIGIALAALMFFIALPILFILLAIGIALFVFAKVSR